MWGDTPITEQRLGVGRKKKWSAEDCERLAKEVNPKLSMILSTFKNSREKCLWIEEGYGEFWCVPQLFIRKKQKGHPLGGFSRISSSKTKTFEQVRQRIRDKFPIFDIDRETFKGASQRCLFIDPIDGNFWATPTIVLAGFRGNPNTRYNRTSTKLRMLPEDVERRVRERNPNLTLVYGTYQGTKKRSTWIENGLGEFLAYSQDLISGKQKGHPRLHDLRCARAANFTKIIANWEDGSEVICQGGYELAVALYLNENRIRYTSQRVNFPMPDGHTYRPDFYLKDEDKFLEIKGYFRKDSYDKWVWFHSQYPNSELWDEAKLKSLGIKARDRKWDKENISFINPKVSMTE